MKLSALNFSAIDGSSDALQSITDTIQLAQSLEALGFVRYWLGEHHGCRVAHSCPEVLVAVLAHLTSRIRVGTGGVLLCLHSPLRIAKQFKLLDSLYPNRIDLGIARGTTDAQTEFLLRDGADKKVDFGQKVADLLTYVYGDSPICVNPKRLATSQAWMLGSHTASMQLAAIHGTAFCFAHFLNPSLAECVTALEAYNRSFKPKSSWLEPYSCIAVAGICADSDAEAEQLLPVNGPVSVKQMIVGGLSKWEQELTRLQAQTGVTEFVVLDLCTKPADKANTYRLLATLLQRGSPRTDQPPHPRPVRGEED